jgi:hypothetical protein
VEALGGAERPGDERPHSGGIGMEQMEQVVLIPDVTT